MSEIEARKKMLIDALMKNVGADAEGEKEGDYRDADGLLVCHVCGKRKESRVDIPGFGVRVHKCMCQCQLDREKREKERQQIQSERDAVRELFSYSLVDERFRESTFANCKVTPNNEKAVRIAKNYVAKFEDMFKMNKGLLLYGPPGTGKTYVASCIANALLAKNVPLLFTSILKLTSVTGPFSREAEEQQVLLEKMNEARLLIIDDLGSERTTDYKMEQVFEIIDSRYSSNRPMIITTNLTLKKMHFEPDLRKKRIYERIYEVCFPVVFTGESWRFETASKDYERIEKMLLE